MKRKELTKTFMMISHLKNPLVSMFFFQNISALQGFMLRKMIHHSSARKKPHKHDGSTFCDVAGFTFWVRYSIYANCESIAMFFLCIITLVDPFPWISWIFLTLFFFLKCSCSVYNYDKIQYIYYQLGICVNLCDTHTAYIFYINGDFSPISVIGVDVCVIY